MTIQETSDRLIEEYKYLEAHEVAHYNKCKFCKPDDYCSKAIYNRHKTKEVEKILKGRLNALKEIIDNDWYDECYYHDLQEEIEKLMEVLA
jgi:hypothetical protein